MVIKGLWTAANKDVTGQRKAPGMWGGLEANVPTAKCAGFFCWLQQSLSSIGMKGELILSEALRWQIHLPQLPSIFDMAKILNLTSFIIIGKLADLMKPPGASWEMITVLIKNGGWQTRTPRDSISKWHSYTFSHRQDYFVHVKVIFGLFPVVSVTKF